MPLAEFQQTTLQECIQQASCPLCRAVWKMDAARFGWYVNDGVLDEETQRHVVRAIGFCAPHALYLSLIEGNDFLWSHLGSCMVYIHVEETQQVVALALIRSVSQVGKRLEAYVHNCTERYQRQMRPEDRVAWFDAIGWFGGSDSAQFLLTSSPTPDTSGE